MSDTEFDVIKKYFTFTHDRDDVQLAGGDDCAIVSVAEGKQLLVTTDTLISGVHFPVSTSAQDIAYKSVMVNFSDLAAMGAVPAWLMLAISLPEIDDRWLQAFSTQLRTLLSDFNVSLIGGDTTKGALSITLTAMGLCDNDKILRRDRAEPGDKIFVTGDLGSAAVGLDVLVNNIDDAALQPCIQSLNRPQARIGFSQKLPAFSRCAIDISDGLLADIGHIVDASACGARIELAAIPLSSAVQYYFQRYNDGEVSWSTVLTRGDDYELCFTAHSDDESALFSLAAEHQLKLSCIGEIVRGEGVLFVGDDAEDTLFDNSGFRHF